MRTRRRWLAVITVAIMAGAAWLTPHIAMVGSGFYAKQLCSGVFISGRPPTQVARDDLQDYPPWLIMYFVRWRVWDDVRAVETNWLGLATRVARFTPGAGCALVAALPKRDDPGATSNSSGISNTSAMRPVANAPGANTAGANTPGALWPAGDRVELLASAALDQALTDAFDASRWVGTRAIVVVHRGHIIAERYAAGFGADTPLAGWSMAKSVVNALVGIQVRDRALTLDTPLTELAPQVLADWRTDERRTITVAHALTMTTGLAFQESYAYPFSDVMTMLFSSSDAVRIAAAKSIRHAPGSAWAYSSGTTNLLTRTLLQTVPEALHARMADALLFKRIGMTSATLEQDAAGTPIGSSFMYATARDWARFGWLFANDGVWAGERLLPEGWVTYSRTPAPHSAGRYGAHFWLSDDSATPGAALPADAFHATGHGMQRITIIPSRELVVVRLGMTLRGSGWDQPAFVARVLGALKPGSVPIRGHTPSQAEASPSN